MKLLIVLLVYLFTYVFTSITSSGPAIYISGYNGIQSSIFKFTLSSAGALPTLTSAVVAAEMPVGEIIHTIKYYANLVNNSAPANEEILYGQQMTGIKGRFATVTMSTDSVTNPGGLKELWSVGSVFSISSY